MALALIPAAQGSDPFLRQLAAVQQINQSIGSIGASLEQRRQQKALADLLLGTPAMTGSIGAGTGFAGSPELGGQTNVGTARTPGLLPELTEQEALAISLNPELAAQVVGAAFNRRLAPPPSPVAVRPGGALVDPRSGQPIYTAPAAPTSSEERLAAAGIQPGTPEAREFLLGRPPVAPSTTVQLPPQETERQKALGQAAGARLSAIADESRNNRRVRAAIGQLDTLMESGVSTGPGTAWRQNIRDLTGLELGDLSGADAFRAVANQLVLQAQVAQKGPQTESDREVIASTFPKIGTSDRANELVIDILEAQSKRLDEELALERRLIEQDGLSVSEAQERVAQEFADKPVFGPDIIRQAQELGGGGGAEPGGIAEGTIATNPRTGQSLIRRGGKWVPL